MAQDPRATFIPSTKTTHPIQAGTDFTFGYLNVPEDRSRIDSKMIRLPVYIFRSRSENPSPDPIIYTVGGPGNSTMSSAPYMNYYRYLDNRDFILFEQRGTQYAEPHLDCPEWSVALSSMSEGVSEKSSDSLLAAAALNCRRKWTTRGVDLNQYHTTQIAADLVDLVHVLGIKQYNLLTLSYSTKIAQVLMRDYPEGIRSVVMDSPLPLESSYDEESLGNLMASLDRLLTDCEKDTDCNTAFPLLKHRFYSLLRSSSETPLRVPVSYQGKIDTLLLRGADLIALFTDQGSGGIAGVPLELEKVLNGDYSYFQKDYVPANANVGDGRGIGMRLCVWCAEEYPFVQIERVKKQRSAYPELGGVSPMVFSPAVCETWDVKAMPRKENRPVRSNIPVLLISGEYDNETPVTWARSMQKRLKNSYHLIFRGWKHTPTTYWSNTCGMESANAFFINPHQKPDISCLSDLGVPKFRTKSESYRTP